jgi:hypothetical protein
VSGAVIETFGVRYVWLLAAVLAAASVALLVRVPTDRQPKSVGGGLLGEAA